MCVKHDRRFCWQHLRNTSIWSCDFLVKSILDFLAPVTCRKAASRFATRSVTARRLCTYAKSAKRPRRWLKSLVPCCRRAQRTLQFVVKEARGDYPVQLQRVKSMSRTRKHIFHNASGLRFSMKGFRVPLRHCYVCKSQTEEVAPCIWGTSIAWTIH